MRRISQGYKCIAKSDMRQVASILKSIELWRSTVGQAMTVNLLCVEANTWKTSRKDLNFSQISKG